MSKLTKKFIINSGGNFKDEERLQEALVMVSGLLGCNSNQVLPKVGKAAKCLDLHPSTLLTALKIISLFVRTAQIKKKIRSAQPPD